MATRIDELDIANISLLMDNAPHMQRCRLLLLHHDSVHWRVNRIRMVSCN